MSNTVHSRADGLQRLVHQGLPAVLACLSLAAAAAGSGGDGSAYIQRNLVSDGSIPAERTDPYLISPWGIAPSPNGTFWIAGNGVGASVGYDSQGNAVPAVEIPGGTPTGIVSNDSADFALPCPGGTTAPSAFIFATEAGVISAWSPRADPANAIPVADNSQGGAVYKGLAIAANGNARYLYASDFHGGKVDVFDSGFKPVRVPTGGFRDPALPAGYAPFGIQNINGNLYITYARQDHLREDVAPGPGQGFISVFDAGGRFLKRLVSRGNLNAPWGMALAPADFGPYANHLLVANFGDGRINAYHPLSGELKGQLRGPDNRPIAIDGLWGICFGKGSGSTLFFTAGPAYENKGLYGRIERAASQMAASLPPAPQPVQQLVQQPVQPIAQEPAGAPTLEQADAADSISEKMLPTGENQASLDPKTQPRAEETAGQDGDAPGETHRPGILL